MNDVMTMAEIESRFPSEWILIGDPQTDQYLEVLGGKVLWHSKDRDEVYQKAIELPAPKSIAFHYTGPIPAEGTELIL
jgi:hypothetical protein